VNALCIQMCSVGLPCGHACPLKCHPGTDSDHTNIFCSTKVERACPAGHKYFTVCSKTAAAVASSCTSCDMLRKIKASDAKKLSAQAAARQQEKREAAMRLAEA
jgi:hypothetical protein